MDESKVKGLVAKYCDDTCIIKGYDVSCYKKDLCDKNKDVEDLKNQLLKAQSEQDEAQSNFNKTENYDFQNILRKAKNKVITTQENLDKANNELFQEAQKVSDTLDGLKGLAKEAEARGVQAVANANGGYVATTRRVILNGGGQKRVVYRKGGKGDDYVKIGGAFVNLKRNFTKKR